MRPRRLCAPLIVAVTALLWALAGSAQAPAPPVAYKDTAVDAAKWIRTSRVSTPFGAAWPADPKNPKSVGIALYNGTPGIVLFLLELYSATGEAAYLDDARHGADDLLTKITSEPQSGLYEGIAGIGFTLGETWRATKDDKYRRAALATVRELQARAQPVGKGVQWNSTADIISGGAGIGLFLLYADRTFHSPDAQALAVRAGDRLIDLGEPASGGVRWPMDPSFPRLMPNFSHGTAGVSYFLATLFKPTRDARFLDAAYAGSRYLRAIASTDGDVCLVSHDSDNPGLFYLGWCHGPAGTARLFYQLYTITNDDLWMTWVRRSANGIIKSGIPEQRTPGFWNNVSQCCGDAGVAEFFLDLHAVTNDRRYLEFATRMTEDLLARATRDGAGTRWVQAENRTEPNVLVAQTGYMQGAAGIGTWLLHLDGALHNRPAFVHFPDSPWP
jgi:lantibiotic modifying enzyme